MLPIDEQKQKQHKLIESQEAQASRHAEMAKEVDRKRELAIAPDGDRPTTDMAAQVGLMMHGDEVRKRLIRLNGYLRFYPGNADPTRMGVYVIDNRANLDDPDPKYRGLRYTGVAMEKDFCPEFSIRVTREEKFWNDEKDCEDTRQVFAGEIRGWRTVVYRLMSQGLIPQAATLKLFPDTSKSKIWHQLVH